MISNIWYGVAIIAHALIAIVGFGALGLTTAYAGSARRSPHPFTNPTLQRFFKTGSSFAEWAVLSIPFFGGLLLVFHHGPAASRAYPWVGLGLWCIAVGCATGIVWPAEREIQEMYKAADALGDASAGALGDDIDDEQRSQLLMKSCERIERAGAVASLCFVAALVVMVVQPF